MDVLSRFADSDAPETGPTGRSVDHLSADLDRTDLASHLAFFYRAPETQLKVATTFVRKGLQKGNQCLYFYDTNTRDGILDALRSAGIDVAARLEAGDLVVRNGVEAYGESGYSPDDLIATLEDACSESQRRGYDGLWVAGEVSWCFHTELAYDSVVGFEADFDASSRELPVTALCQYDLNRFDEESVAKALWTHEQVLYRYTVCENPYYLPPERFRDAGDDLLNTQLLLEQLFDISRANREVDRYGQRLSVINRVLRHNIRNSLNVIQGVVDLVARSEELGEADQERLSTAMTSADEIVEIAEKARYVESTIEESTVGPVALEVVLDAVRERIGAVYPAAGIVVDGEAGTPVLADETLATGLVELVAYAFGNQDVSPPEVTLRVTDTDYGMVRLEFEYPGDGVPERERHALAEGVETQLTHCDGLGLWLARWIIENGDGRLALLDGEGPQIRVELHPVVG